MYHNTKLTCITILSPYVSQCKVHTYHNTKSICITILNPYVSRKMYISLNNNKLKDI